MTVTEEEKKVTRYEEMFEAEKDHWWYRGLRYLLFYYILKYKPANVLDAGCGTGMNARLLQDGGYNVYAVDSSEKALEFARKRGAKNLTRGSVVNLPYNNNTFDLIYCLDVIACLKDEDAVRAIKEFNRCLKPNGVLIINVAALLLVYSRHDAVWEIKRRYTAQGLKKALDIGKMRVVKMTYRVSLLFPLILAYRLLEALMAKVSRESNPKDINPTNKVLNEILFAIMRAENALITKIYLPVGNSLFSISTKV